MRDAALERGGKPARVGQARRPIRDPGFAVRQVMDFRRFPEDYHHAPTASVRRGWNARKRQMIATS